MSQDTTTNQFTNIPSSDHFPKTVEPDGFKFLSAGVEEIDHLIRGHELERHVYELELLGYTVLENALNSLTLEILSQRLLTCAGEDDHRPIDPSGGSHLNRTQEVMLLLARGGRPMPGT